MTFLLSLDAGIELRAAQSAEQNRRNRAVGRRHAESDAENGLELREGQPRGALRRGDRVDAAAGVIGEHQIADSRSRGVVRASELDLRHARRLNPPVLVLGGVVEEEQEDPRAELVKRLLEYEKFKENASTSSPVVDMPEEAMAGDTQEAKPALSEVNQLSVVVDDLVKRAVEKI